jgi:hypothetical protein
LVFLALEARVLMKLPQERAGIEPQALAQFGGRQPGGGLAHERHQSLGQMAMAGKANVLVEPEALRVELGDGREGVEAPVLIETGHTLPGLEPTANRAHRGVQEADEIREGEHFFAGPETQDLGRDIRCVCHSIGSCQYINIYSAIMTPESKRQMGSARKNIG